MFNNLWQRTKNVAATYTWTFIVVMVLNQLLFFGFCLNPICLIAAMPHVLAITVALGSWFNKINGWGNDEQHDKQVSEPARRAVVRLPAIGPSSSFSVWRSVWTPTVDRTKWIPKRLAAKIIQDFPPRENGSDAPEPASEHTRFEKALCAEFNIQNVQFIKEQKAKLQSFFSSVERCQSQSKKGPNRSVKRVH